MKAAVVLVLSALATSAVSGQQNGATFRAGVDLVALNVVVVNPQQQFVRDLTASSFAVFEDGVQQDVSFFATSEAPLDLAVLLDTSASMRQKLATAREAATGFVSALRPVDRSLVLDIKDSSRLLAPLSHNLAAANDAIRATSADGSTALYNGLYLTLTEMARQRRGETDMRRQAIVLLSDGDDTSSLVTFDDVMELARRSGTAIYSIMLAAGPEEQLERRKNEQFSKSEHAMRALASETGGRTFSVLDIKDLAGVYTSIGQELASQYALGYMSSNPRRDGAYRRVVVRIIDRDNVQPRTRAGYLAAGRPKA